ncbi:TIP41-like protein, partial [Gossypium arboreum]|uniref:TIP41-like protein n=1 Tax=Gossypium arboreum TaxID=29729 RepID=UPI0022F19333
LCYVAVAVTVGLYCHNCRNALDAFYGWKHEGLPPVKVPSAAQWKFRRTQGKKFQRGAQASIRRIAHCSLMSLRSHEKNQFFSVMRLLLVDKVLLRLWDTRIYCVFDGSAHPAILRDRCWKESTYQSLSTVKEYKGFSKFGMV